MSDLFILFDQLLFISALIGLLIILYRVPNLLNCFNHNSLYTQDQIANNLTSKLVIQMSKLIPDRKIKIISFHRMKVKNTPNKDLEDCCPLL